jgi:hypothetical protein
MRVACDADRPLERALQAARVVVALLAMVALESDPYLSLPLGLTPVIVLGWHVLMALLVGLWARSERNPRLVASALLCVAALPLALLPNVTPSLVLFALGSASFELAFRGRARHRLALLATLIPMLMAAFLLQLRPSLPILFLAPLATLCSTSAGLFLHRRASRDAVRPAARTERLPGESRRRLAAGLPIGILLATTSLVFFLGGTELGVMLGTDRREAPSRALTRGAERSETQRDRERGDASGQQNSGPQNNFDSHIGFGGGVFPFSTAEVLRLRPETGQRVPRVVYLRGVVLDRIEREGVAVSSRRRTRIRTDAEDGSADGWTHVRPRESSQVGDVYHVDGRVLSLEESAWTPLFAAEPLTAVQLARIAYEADRGLLLPDPPDRRMRYAFEVASKDWSPSRLSLAAARHPEASTIQLPQAILTLPGLGAFLQEACRPGQSDWEQVLGIVRCLRTAFTYERLETGFEGIAALGPFLEQRRGFCTHFATLAVVALRTQGLSARIATGFLAHEWDPEALEFVVRDKHAHAWIEVYFEDIGWVPFDPTPAQEGRPELEDGYAPGELAAQGLKDAIGAWIGNESGTGSLSNVLVAAGSALWAWFGREPALILALLLAVMLLRRVLGTPGSSRRRTAEADSAASNGGPESKTATRLVQALAAAGIQRSPGQSLLSLALEAKRSRAALAGAVTVARLHYAARWGRTGIAAERLEASLQQLENLPLTEEGNSAPRQP